MMTITALKEGIKSKGPTLVKVIAVGAVGGAVAVAGGPAIAVFIAAGKGAFVSTVTFGVGVIVDKIFTSVKRKDAKPRTEHYGHWDWTMGRLPWSPQISFSI